MSPPMANSAANAPKQVSRFEANLLTILRYVFHQVPAEQALKLIKEPMNAPPCLSAAAVHLVRDTLSKGCILYLARAGGWKRQQFLRDGKPSFGRVWERARVDELTLMFSAHTLEFLLWITAANVDNEKTAWSAPAEELTVADWLFFLLVYEGLRANVDMMRVLRPAPIFSQNVLCLLAYPEDFAAAAAGDLSFGLWSTGLGALVLEALHPFLESRWLDIERSKGQIGDWTQMRQQGQLQLQLLERFLSEADRVNRPDLARFLLGVLNRVLSTADLTPSFWTGGLQGTGPQRLADRLETQRSALALLRQAQQFRQWQQRSQTRSYFDDDYQAAKFWLSQWETLDGERVVRRAEQIVRMLEPLRSGAP